WKTLEGLFQLRLQQIQKALLPSQQRSMRKLPAAKQWEKTQYFLKVNHQRLLKKLPPAFQRELKGQSLSRQARRIRELMRQELKQVPASGLQRLGIRQLPLLLQWDAIQRLKKRMAKKKTKPR
ncbi:MAG: hypothetical protein ACYTHN_17980, partial [Planctomycetota bacterium]